jgi:hypothetical protein
MTDKSVDFDVFIDASTQALGLPLDPAWKDAVRGNLQVIFAHAAKVNDFSLPDEAEPAPVFKA